MNPRDVIIIILFIALMIEIVKNIFFIKEIRKLQLDVYKYKSELSFWKSYCSQLELRISDMLKTRPKI
jgi:hypothetical protein